MRLVTLKLQENRGLHAVENWLMARGMRVSLQRQRRDFDFQRLGDTLPHCGRNGFSVGAQR